MSDEPSLEQMFGEEYYQEYYPRTDHYGEYEELEEPELKSERQEDEEREASDLSDRIFVNEDEDSDDTYVGSIKESPIFMTPGDRQNKSDVSLSDYNQEVVLAQIYAEQYYEEYFLRKGDDGGDEGVEESETMLERRGVKMIDSGDSDNANDSEDAFEERAISTEPTRDWFSLRRRRYALSLGDYHIDDDE